jgi:anti-sigma factor RsiW
MDCEHVEVEIEKRARGALSPAESAAVDVHLAGCASCRAFEHTVEELETAMRTNTTHELSTVDWNQMERGLAAMAATYRKALPRMAVATVPLIALITWAAEPAERLTTALLAAALAVGILMVGMVVRHRMDAKLAAIAEGRADLTATYRDELDVTIRRLRHGRVYLPIFGAGWLAVGISQLVGGAPVPTIALWLGVGMVFVGQAALAHRQLGHRLRERAELG